MGAWRAGHILLLDHTTLSRFGEPLLPLDADKPTDTAPDRLLYPVLLDQKSGTNQLSNSWYLVYAYWPAREARDQKYLVFREITISGDHAEGRPQVGLLIARWRSVKQDDRWSTIAPVPGNYTSYQLDAKNGYVMSVPPREPSAQLEECVKVGGGRSDHMLAERGFCAAHSYLHLRMAGWAYMTRQADTIPLYRCYDPKARSHFASNDAGCEKLGQAEQLLGFVMQR